MDYHDAATYVLFHLDKNDFRRIQLINGQAHRTGEEAARTSMVDSLSATVQMEVAPGSICQTGFATGDQWVVLIPGRRPAQLHPGPLRHRH